jgi:hypothetical protein
MKLIFVSVTLLCVALCIIPIGGMSESNPNHNIYIYGFLSIEILTFVSLIRFTIINRKNK